MLRRLFSLLFLGGLLGFALESHAQTLAIEAASQEPERKEALIIVNSTIITNKFLAKMDPDSIESQVVYRARAQNAPAILQGLIPNGALAIEYAQKVDSNSFADIAKQLGLAGPLVFVLDGYELTTRQVAELRILPEAIGQVQVTKATPEVPLTTVNIELAKFKPAVHPTGTVLTR